MTIEEQQRFHTFRNAVMKYIEQKNPIQNKDEKTCIQVKIFLS
jgi:hypothetical protein